jgi:proteasome-associated ATPase
MSNEKETIQALEKRVGEYENLIKEMLGESKMIGTITAGPEKIDGNQFYRVNVKGSELVLVSNVKEKIEKKTEVIVTETFIAKALPKALITIKEVEPFKTINWEEVGGLKSQIQEIKRQVEGPLSKASLYKEFGIEPSKGILLYGPPGCGKTLISRVIASSIIDQKKGSNESFVYIKGPELLSMYVGSTEEKIRNIFNECRKRSKKTGSRSVIFIDEAESLLSKRGTGISSDMNSTIVPQFLAEMDGFDSDSPFVLLSTNLPQSLDPAIIREGRIDLKVEIKRPTAEDAIEIFGIHLKKVKTYEDLDTLTEYGATELYKTGIAVSGSMIKTIANMAATEALYRYSETKKQKGIIPSDLSAAIQKITNSQI